MSLQDAMNHVDSESIVRLRRALHRYPEIGFDLPRTAALVQRELDALGIAWTDRYAPCSVVGSIGQGTYTLAIRADMDALPIHERNEVPYRSEIDGAMHACGHDAHTAMLLGTARALKSVEDELKIRVKFIFQPSEEGAESGARVMVENGVMEDVDAIIGLHVENRLDAGCIGVCPGASMAASNPVTIEFSGRSAHATLPQSGHDALAMAVKTYMGIQLMLTREIDPFARYVCSVGQLHAGRAVNVVPDQAWMKLSLRAFDDELLDFIVKRITKIAEHAADELGGEVRVTSTRKAYPVVNDPDIRRDVLDAARAVVGDDGIVDMPVKMSSEDFSFYLREKPGVFFRLGTRNPDKGCVTFPHNDDFMIDEDALAVGSRVCVRFALDRSLAIAGR